ncbi:MAG: NAD(P)H-hydrate dehydratase [Aquincola tertiaricarbonis]|uniref:NAD(P)H-hydrate dehydratase n=1 Tax=Aquincola TaxID=391952 RepID=UPI000614BE95|nr:MULTISPECIES: NAD(P)H-hydrate dehydratase [Aquincola]MCR5864189.1 NAD(P)H-hydrate dehydratase [Aquincola sp. J276]
MSDRLSSLPPPLLLDEAALRAWPLPLPDEDGDKEQRGRVLVIAGGPEMPGAAVLSAVAAMRAGAGKLTIATAASVAAGVALAVPEARVLALPETAAGGLAAKGLALLEDILPSARAVLFGPGVQDEGAAVDFARGLLTRCRHTALVLDAYGMCVVKSPPEGQPWPPRQAWALTPHAGEMASLTGIDKDEVQARPLQLAQQAARQWQAVVALKGRQTFIAAPGEERAWQHDGGNVGLATSGSGDVLAGLVAGLAARGAPLAQACAWGVVLHAHAGDRLTRRLGMLGLLARELPGEVPDLLRELGPCAA